MNTPKNMHRGLVVTPWILTLLFLGIVFIITTIGVQRIKGHSQLQSRDSLIALMQSTQESLHLWVHQRKRDIRFIASQTEFIKMTEALLTLAENQEVLTNSQVQKNLRRMLEPFISQNNDKGYFVISPGRVSLASSRNSNIGTTNLIEQQRRTHLDNAFGGNTVFVPTLVSDVVLDEYRVAEKTPTAFIATPVRNSQGNIIATFAVRIDTSQHFNRIIKMGRLGLTGETYTFDRRGILTSHSRFDNQLKQIGLLAQDEDSIMSIKISDPGKNLLSSVKQESTNKSDPFTLMADSALKGNSGSNVSGYRDYRGVMVYGAWAWDDNLDIGIATEWDETEALSTYYQFRKVMWLVLSMTVFLSLTLLAITLFFQRRSKLNLTISNRLLETRVEERTSELEATQKELEKANKELEFQAVTDGLTNIPNRRCFDQHIKNEWTLCTREKWCISVIMLDIDQFKQFNDHYGHQKGDQCLIDIAKAIVSANVIRRPGDLFARYGGEEFVFVLSHTDVAFTQHVAETVLKVITDLNIPHEYSDVETFVTASLGVSTVVPRLNISPSLLVKRADAALYKSKSMGRNQVQMSHEL